MLRRFLRDLLRFWPYAVRSAKASLKAEVAGSYLNWLWWILNPIAFMLIYTLIFGVIFRAAEPYFPLYVFIGLTMWDFFQRVVVQSVRIIHLNRSIVSKVYLPKFMLVISDMIVNAIKMLISFVVIALMMLAYRLPFPGGFLYLLPVLAGFFLFTFGIGCFMMHFGVYVRDLTNVVNIVLRLVFYFTGIFFDIETRIPAPFNYWVLRLNPVAAFITQVRNVLLFGRVTHVGLLLAWSAFSALLAALSVTVVYQNENSYFKVM